jgi:hypothetical protein
MEDLYHPPFDVNENLNPYRPWGVDLFLENSNIFYLRVLIQNIGNYKKGIYKMYNVSFQRPISPTIRLLGESLNKKRIDRARLLGLPENTTWSDIKKHISDLPERVKLKKLDKIG